MAPSSHLAGEAHKRFTAVATLLSLIDPVRGEPTVHNLDRHPHDRCWQPEHLQKKFLDSFAFICSTSARGRETAAAVCLEQCHPLHTILRVARNRGFPTDVISQLQQIIDTLASGASQQASTKERECEILQSIVNLTRDKISHLLKKLRKPQIQELVYQGLQRHSQEKPPSKDIVSDSFGKWIANLPNLIVFDPDSGERPAILLSHIAWASYAKWRYSEQLEHFFCSGGNEFPDWIGYIYKLGRFYTAAKTLLKLAARQPDLVSSMRVEAIDAPSQVPFSVSDDETALMRVVQRLATSNPEELMSRLGQFWVTEDPEARFRKACRLTLTVHAEMQLLSFYDHHPELAPRLAFMGTSKKTCFLCHEFMSRHPLAIGASACHQKLYPSWMPAPCSVANVRKEHKVLLWHLSQHLEQTAARDLQTRLGVRKPKSLDSTAGPSLSTTDNGAPKWWVHELATQLFRQKLESSEELGPDKADG